MFAIGVEAIIYLLLYNLHDCTFNDKKAAGIRSIPKKNTEISKRIDQMSAFWYFQFVVCDRYIFRK